MKKISEIIAKSAMKTAKKSLGKASDWFLFQVKEPKNLRKLISK